MEDWKVLAKAYKWMRLEGNPLYSGELPEDEAKLMLEFIEKWGWYLVPESSIDGG